jgi:LPS O-antigen subunit length determinant protein (WzzB/FepE family)
MHGEALKNLEYADFTLRNKTPFITLLDSPLSPISPNAESKLKALVIGLILGIMIGVTFVLGRKIYRDTMNS